MEPRINEKIECSHCNYLFAIFDRSCFCFENMADVHFCPKCGASFQSNAADLMGNIETTRVRSAEAAVIANLEKLGF